MSDVNDSIVQDVCVVDDDDSLKKDSTIIKGIDTADVVNLSDSTDDLGNFGTDVVYEEKKYDDDDNDNDNNTEPISCTDRIKNIPSSLKKLTITSYNKIPKEFFSWKRWVGFVISVTVLFVIFWAIPTEAKVVEGVTTNPNWYSMVPPVLAICFAVFFKQVLLALSLAIFVGGMIAFKGNVYHVFVYLIFHNFWNVDNGYVVGFTLCLVGMVYVMHKSGGLDGLCKVIGRFATNTYSTRIVTAIAGIIFFFDDYGNTVVVGSTFKGLAARMQISSEKLAYLVDSTAAPVAGVAIISTWIGVEVSYFENVAKELNITISGYEMFLNALPYRFYCFGALFLVFVNVIMARDFGPMLEAEKRALIEGKIHADGAKIGKDLSSKNAPPADIPKRWQYAFYPLLVVIFGSLLGMFWDGRAAVYAANESLDIFNGEAWRLAIGECHSVKVMFYAALAATAFAFVLPIYGRTITFNEATISFLTTFPSMFEAILLLYLAWGIKSTCDHLNTKHYLVAILGDISLQIVPLVTFLLATFTALAIGSSWATMGILIPIMMEIAWILGVKDPNTATGLDAHSELIFYLTGSAVLDGAILGDHCSPISDTTVLSSVTTNCDLIDHVKTQLPYSLLGGLIAAVFGYVCVAYNMHFGIYYPLALIIGIVVFFIFGTKLPKANDLESNPGLKAKDIVCRSPFMSLVHRVSGGRLG